MKFLKTMGTGLVAILIVVTLLALIVAPFATIEYYFGPKASALTLLVFCLLIGSYTIGSKLEDS